jgi:choline dehydrogenase-like flavoprotein
MPENTYDAIVIGSGISGGWAAKELTEKGLKTIMLERGRNVEHIKDYVNATKGPWEFPHRGGRTQQMIKDYPNLKRDYPLNETNLDFWVNEKESPYTQKSNDLTGIAVTRLVADHLHGEDNLTDGVILVLKPMPKTELQLIGPFVIKT